MGEVFWLSYHTNMTLSSVTHAFTTPKVSPHTRAFSVHMCKTALHIYNVTAKPVQ